MPNATKDATPWNILGVLDIVNTETQGITCLAEWDDHDEDRTVRCDGKIAQDAQLKAWKQLLDLPWGSKDSSEWRVALRDAAKLLSCTRHNSVVHIDSVTMAWASVAVLHTHKARGDRLLLGHCESTSSRAVVASKLRPRRATTAAKPRVLMGFGRSSSTCNTPCRPQRHGKSYGELGRASRKDSAADSRHSLLEDLKEQRQAHVHDPSHEPAIFQLDEITQKVHDGMLRDCNLESRSHQKRIRSFSDPEVHMDNAENAQAGAMPIRRQSAIPDSTSTSAQDYLRRAARYQVDLPALDEMIEREHNPGPCEGSIRHPKQQQWDHDRDLRKKGHPVGESQQHTDEEAARQRDRDLENVEERVRAVVESESDMESPLNEASDRPVPSVATINMSWGAYMEEWVRLLQLDPDCTEAELCLALPRPVLGHELQSQYRGGLTEHFERDVSDFFRNMPEVKGQVTDRFEFRRKLKEQVSRWHPDKLTQRFPSAQQEKVMELATRVTQVITVLIARA